MTDDFPMHDLARQAYAPVGRCIYCGSIENLTDEHIIPLALNGFGVLPKSSCVQCAKTTGQFEQQVLRGSMWPLRVARGLKSRTKHRDAPAKSAIRIMSEDGSADEVEVPFGAPPFVMICPLFSGPACIEPEGYTTGIRVLGLNSYGIGVSPEDVLDHYRAKQVTWMDTGHPVPFARMIAKIAYASAFAERIFDLIDGDSLVLPAFMRIPDDIGKWVGTARKPLEVHAGHLHRVTFGGHLQSGLLIAEVQLFADNGLPTYTVVLGRLKPATVSPTWSQT
jgi:hypothetical protein